MEEQQKTCIMYVDYEGLLVGLSYSEYFDIDNLLIELLEKAQQRFHLQGAIVLGDWTHHASRPRLEEAHFLCHSVSASGAEISRMLQSTVKESLTAGNAAEAYIFVSGASDYNQLLRLLRQANRESVLWTLTAPSATDRVLCSQWELIPLPVTGKASAWPRPVILQAIALAADHLENDIGTPFSLNLLRDHLEQLTPFSSRSDIWLAIASREQILFQQQAEDAANISFRSLNRQHPVVQKALLTRERILSTLASMLVNRQWVAFGSLEKGLRTSRLLTVSQDFRHAWLELLIAEGVLTARQIPQPDGPFRVTALSFNQKHPLIAILQNLQFRNFIWLIVAMSNSTSRKASPWIPVANLLKILTEATTRVEARSTLHAAELQGIVEIGSVPARHHLNPVATASLRFDHTLVQETLARRDQLITLTYAVLTSRSSGVSETVLAEAFTDTCSIQKDEAQFWIRLLISEGILYMDQILLGSDEATQIIYLNDQHPVVDLVLSTASKQTHEVK